MSVSIQDNFDTAAAKPIDDRYGPYNSDAAAATAIPEIYRYQGLTVGVITAGGVEEYWWNNTLTGNPIKKTASGNITSISQGTGILVSTTSPNSPQAPKISIDSNVQVTGNLSTNVSADGGSDSKYPSVKAVKTYADGLIVGLLNDRGNYAASTTSPGPYPSTGGSGTPVGTIVKGDIWFIKVSGTGYLGTTPVITGSSVRALVDNPSPSNDAHWDILDVGLGFTPENVANKVTTAANISADPNSVTKYPSVSALTEYLSSYTPPVPNLQAVTNVAPSSTTNTISAASFKFNEASTSNYAELLCTSTGVVTIKDSLGNQRLSLNKSGTDLTVWTNNGTVNSILDFASITSTQTFTFPNATGTIALIESLSGTSPVNYDTTTGVISMSAANASTDGYLTQGDWTTFNNKQNVTASLTSLNNLTYSSTAFVKMTGANTFSLDYNTYLTSSSLNNYVPYTGSVNKYVNFASSVNANYGLNIGVNTSYSNTAGIVEYLGPWVGVNLTSVTIGTQIWSLKNLDVTTYKNGDNIPLVNDPTAWAALTTGARCCPNNDCSPSNISTYGYLYNWYAVNDPRGLAPTGWHVAKDAEWLTLRIFLGGQLVAGSKMKEAGTSHWQSPNLADNSSGFTALPAGYRNNAGAFLEFGTFAYWFTSDDPTISLYNYTTNNSIELFINYGPVKGNGFSVRVIKDTINTTKLIAPNTVNNILSLPSSTGTLVSTIATSAGSLSTGTDGKVTIPDATASVTGLVNTTTQTFNGDKTFSASLGTVSIYANKDIITNWDGSNGVRIGKYKNNNLIVGQGGFVGLTTGDNNVSIGNLAANSITTGNNNTCIGNDAGRYITTGSSNIVIGKGSTLSSNFIGDNNVIIGGNLTGITGVSNNIILADGAGNRRITVDSSGNVGIGTATPSSKLDVDGQISTDTLRAKSEITLQPAGGNTLITITKLGVTNYQAGQINLSKETNGSPTVTTKISADGNSYFIGGNVGIGKSSPSYKLDVDGNIATSNNNGILCGGILFFNGSTSGSVFFNNSIDPSGISGGTGYQNIHSGGSLLTTGYTGLFTKKQDDNTYKYTLLEFPATSGAGTTVNTRYRFSPLGNVGFGYIPAMNDTNTAAANNYIIKAINNTGQIAKSIIYEDPTNNNIGIGTSTPNAAAKLQVDSTTQGFLPPRMTAAQKSAITNPPVGLMIYQTDNADQGEGIYVKRSDQWNKLDWYIPQ